LVGGDRRGQQRYHVVRVEVGANSACGLRGLEHLGEGVLESGSQRLGDAQLLSDARCERVAQRRVAAGLLDDERPEREER
jgi:hypothetical protein